MLFRHAAAYLLSRVSAGLVTSAALVLHTRYVDPADYGTYATTMACVLLANAVIFLWLPVGVLRFLPHDEKEALRFLTTATSAFVALVLLDLLTSALIASLMAQHHAMASLFLMGAVLLCAHGAFDLQLEVARSTLDPRRYAILSGAKATLTAVVGGSLAWFGMGSKGLFIGVGVGLIVPTFASLLSTLRRARPRPIDSPLIRKLAIYGLPLAFAHALVSVVSTSDRLILAYLIGPSAAGQYAVGYDLTRQSLGVLMTSIALAGYPLAVRALESQGQQAAKDRLRETGVVLIAIGLPAAAGLAVLADDISNVVLGESYRAVGAQILPVIAAATLLQSLKTNYLDYALHLSRDTRAQLKIASVIAPISISLNLAMVSWLGLIGAAYAAALTYAIAAVATWHVARRLFPVSLPIGECGGAALATAGMALCLYALRGPHGSGWLVIKAAVGLLVYAALLVALNVAGSRQWLFARHRSLSWAKRADADVAVNVATSKAHVR